MGSIGKPLTIGTNGGTPWTRPATPPAASDTVLVSTNTYSAAGWLGSRTDPRGLVEQYTYDNLGRTTQTSADYTNGVPTLNSNVTTQYAYDGNDHLVLYTAGEPGGLSQQTKYLYGVTTAGGSAVNSNDILAAVQWPDPSTGLPSSSQQETYTADGLGEPLTHTDPNGTTHSYLRDVLGRLTSDQVTALGSGVDGAVQRRDIAYDTQGNPYLFTGYSTPAGSTVVNQVQDLFNGLGQLTTEYQSHSGAVNTSTTPKVQYAYVDLAGGANNSRRTSMTYPNGRVLNDNYATGVDNTISRLTSLSDSSATLEQYAYLGLDTVVQRSHPQTGVNLTYIQQSGDTHANTDGGDKYTGLDRFGRVLDQFWTNPTTSSTTDRFQYGYDRDSNVLYRNNLVNTAFGELYHASGAGNGYDGLNQLTGFQRGVLSASQPGGTLDTVSSPSHSQSWTLDALGNWTAFTSDSNVQARTHNQQNEVLTAGSSALSFDKDGNATTDENGHTLTFDAWNQLVQVKNGSTVLATYSYDPLGRRIVANSGTATDLYYSDAWQVLEEDQGGAAKVQYVWDPLAADTLVERDRDPNNSGTLSERLYAQQDANGDVTALVNTSGAVVERYVYDPYGAPTFLTASWVPESGSSVGMLYLFQGGRYDPATGYYNFRNRDLSPTLGRWLQTDPLGFAAGDSNLYRDVGNNPTGASDPSGLEEEPAALRFFYGIVDPGGAGRATINGIHNAVGSVASSLGLPITPRSPSPSEVRRRRLGAIWGQKGWARYSFTYPPGYLEREWLRVYENLPPEEREAAMMGDTAENMGELVFLGLALFGGVEEAGPAGGADALVVGRRGGAVVGEARLAELQRLLRDEHNVILWVDKEGRYLAPGQGAMYRAYPNGPSYMYVRPGATEYEIFHESMHMLHHQAVGSRYFALDPDPVVANRMREPYVYDQLIESPYWHRLSRGEQQHAIDYIGFLGGDTRGRKPCGAK